MRDTAGEKSELLQRFGFAPLGFVALPLGDVAENKDYARDFILAVANRGGDLLDNALNRIARS